MGTSSQVVTKVETRRLVRMEQVPERPGPARPLGRSQPRGPVFSGDGRLDYVCAECFSVICKDMMPAQLCGLVVRCACGTSNRVPA